MSNMQIKFMSENAIGYLKSNIEFVTTKLHENPENGDWLKSCISGELFVPKKYEVAAPALSIPHDQNDKETDFKNSVELFRCFNTLPGYVLSDERFWLWVNFEVGYQIAQANMPITPGSSVFKDHWLFIQGKRRGLFFGVLSRCYFRVALTVDNELDDPYELTRFVIENPERFRNLTWRAFSSNKSIVAGALRAEKRLLEENFSVESAAFYAEVAKAISRAGSLKLLDCMSADDVEKLVYNEFANQARMQGNI